MHAVINGEEIEALRAQFDAKCNEESELRAQLRAAELEAQQIRLKMRAEDPSLVPADLRAGGSNTSSAAELATQEHERLLEWLADIADMSQQIVFNAPGEFNVGGHRLTLGCMVQWPLAGATGGLKLSVPVHLEQTIVSLLARARKGLLGKTELCQLAQAWELVCADVASEEKVQPSIFLVHRETLQALIISSWPPLPPLLPGHNSTTGAATASTAAGFSPDDHFRVGQPPAPIPASMAVGKVSFVAQGCGLNTIVPYTHCQEQDTEATPIIGGGGLVWSMPGHTSRRCSEVAVHFDATDRCVITGPFGPVVIAEPSPGVQQRELVRHILFMANQHKVRITCDRNHGERWLPSTTESPAAPIPVPYSEEAPKEGSTAAFEAQDSISEGTGQRAPGVAPPVVLSTVSMSPGDSVQVEYEGEWFSGVLESINGELAHVKCDVDEPGVITVAHISNVRPTPSATKVVFRRSHFRARSEPCPPLGQPVDPTTSFH
eukprot:TRINITY_DN21169_c0_g1_i1.p1 TRINITY_DN21169_c0_g1~~TRINITY_DN21169_c0_g1_i1.p1  ORF type:complete len:491 (+),score=84.82 TRINITY_DN21169_c0_g1_i1:139-1611(+)